MRNKNKHNSLLVLMLLMMLASCNQHTMNKSDKKGEKCMNGRVAIELIFEREVISDSILKDLEVVQMERYKWKNHIVLFGYPKDTVGISGIINNSGFNPIIKRYNEPMYVFNRAIHCKDSLKQQPWNNYLLTANLVNDSVLQSEYISYHDKQFDEWPEVAQGFCYAEFQELLVYKTGRQLLLVISIPGDKTLDELNPKTIENNPRMVEWNTIMGKYQEGIKGTAPGETWVFLEKRITDN